MQNYSDLEDKNSFGLLLKSTREYYGINQILVPSIYV